VCWYNSHKASYRDSTIPCQRKSGRKVQNVRKLTASSVPKLQLNLANEKVLKTCKPLIEMELVLNISVSLPMAFAAEAHRAEGQIRRLGSKLKSPKSLKFLFGRRWASVSMKVGHYYYYYYYTQN
jgi:hypothetical protein